MLRAGKDVCPCSDEQVHCSISDPFWQFRPLDQSAGLRRCVTRVHALPSTARRWPQRTKGEPKAYAPGSRELPFGPMRRGIVMNKKSTRMTVSCAALIVSGLAATGCQKIGETSRTLPDAIPAGLGDLVAVTPGDGQRQAVLWFKQPDQTVVAVRVYLPAGITKYPRP
jgi:hypothetical protein